MNSKILAVCLMSVLMAGCTLSLSDNNPKPVSILGQTGTAGASIAHGMLTLSGSNLDHVTGVALTPNGGPTTQLGPITSRTSSFLTATLPAALRLPGMLILSTSANAAQAELSTLDMLSVDGALTVGGNTTLTGTTDAGFMKQQATCVNSAGFCLVTCPAGMQVISGGCFVNNSGIGLSANYPSANNQWTCRPTNTATVDAYAICGRMALTY